MGSSGKSSEFGARREVTVAHLVLDDDECAIHRNHSL
jgi:hypothetical protein